MEGLLTMYKYVHVYVNESLCINFMYVSVRFFYICM